MTPTAAELGRFLSESQLDDLAGELAGAGAELGSGRLKAWKRLRKAI
jgi:hypothetical protein